MKFSRLLEKIGNLETIEQKSFWAVAILGIFTSIASFIAAPSLYESKLYTIAGFLSLLIPLLLMYYTYKNHNYHIAYPLLCMMIGGLVIPLMLYVNGGFYSGMPLFCLVGSIICAFCYERLWRIITLLITFLANGISFAFVKMYGTVNAISPGQVENDIVVSYFITAIALYCVISVIINTVRNYAISDDAMKQYIDVNVRRQIIEQANSGVLNYNGEHKNIFCLFMDISHFTTTTEKMSPEDTAEYLNTFLEIAEEKIHANSGIVDKYIGDCVMAYWIDNEKKGLQAMDVVNTVFDIRHELFIKAEEIYNRFGHELNFSAGIEYGDVIFGNIGSPNRKDYTVIGDAVNTANRIESEAAGGDLLVSEKVAEMILNKVKMEPLADGVFLKGKSNPIKLFLVKDIIKDETEATFIDLGPQQKEEGFTFYICGCRGSFPVSGIRYSEFGGETSCYVLKKDNYAIVIDCGTGLRNAEGILKDCTKIDILLTHVHYDHVLGLLFPPFPRKAEIHLYGHLGGWNGKNTISYFIGQPYWPYQMDEWHSTDVILGQEIELDYSVGATFFRADHPDSGCVIRLNVGSRKICIFADCETTDDLSPRIAMDSDLLLYDGMYDRRDKTDHTGYGHSTWQDGVEYGIKENAKKLIITHHNHNYGDYTLLSAEKEARRISPTASFARAGDRYKL